MSQLGAKVSDDGSSAIIVLEDQNGTRSVLSLDAKSLDDLILTLLQASQLMNQRFRDAAFQAARDKAAGGQPSNQKEN